MFLSTKGVVLRHIKYSDNAVILHVFTEKCGRVSFILRGIKSKKTGSKTAYIQPLTLLEIETDFRPKAEIQQVKEVRISTPFTSIPFDYSKSAVALFIAEVLSKSIKEENQQQELFDYVYHCITYLDNTNDNISSFHLVFLAGLLKYLGFMPLNNYSEEKQIFDMRDGIFRTMIPNHPQFMNPETSRYFSFIIHCSITESLQLDIPKLTRAGLMLLLLEFYKIHLPSFREIQSFEILTEVFR